MPRHLSEIGVHLEQVAPGTSAIPTNVPDDSGLRTKLGGDPDWIQDDETPDCDNCDEEMSFICQIDSIHHDSKYNPLRRDCLGRKQEYMFGDVGMIYVFFCFDCCETTAVCQC